MYLVNPYLIIIGILFVGTWALKRRSYLGYSDLSVLGQENCKRRKAFKVMASRLPDIAFAMAIALMLVAFARPQKKEEKLYSHAQARDIILVMDLSWSMNNSLYTGSGEKKIDLARKAALEFVKRRDGDRVALFLFGDEVFGAWPLTTDLVMVEKKLEKLGRQFLGGTNLEKPFYQAFRHFSDMGSKGGKIIIFVSDGDAPIREEAKAAIVAELKRLGAKFYLLGIKLNDAKDILDVIRRGGGSYLNIENEAQFAGHFSEVDRIEKANIEVESKVLYKDIFPLFVVAALGLLLAKLSLENTLFIRIP